MQDLAGLGILRRDHLRRLLRGQIRQHSPRELATALMRFGSSPTLNVPSGALAVVPRGEPEPEVVTRVTRLLSPVTKLPMALTTALLSAAALLPVGTMGLWHAPY
jgi:hypothetical protein